MIEKLDVGHLRTWIGGEEVAEEQLTPALVQRFQATFDLAGLPPQPGDIAPRLIHFCLCQPAAPTGALGEDGHPARGGFLPPVPLPRRMWAGSDIRFSGDLRVGDLVRRRSRVADVVVKQGRSGLLCFVTVDHHIDSAGTMRVEDRQTIVYRAADTAGAPAAPVEDVAPTGVVAETVDPTPTLLFRYSALTFNGHRIHYDHPHVTESEGYPGLIVHGPLQATLLLQFATRQRDGIPPDRFIFRGQSPLFDGTPFVLHAGAAEADTMQLWTARSAGPIALIADASWQSGAG
ncbi:MaoC family dehydratase N-terminal domain-containing protein [Hephaestia sp. GCM10023244]|uniref:FAS1-like dehydratase domain-containing protein n=1 Tax=unclassified Hephaestia TaxID=2631281 RepID=UPI0020777E49|nr:MaoC family dehydratase N-terminal domain-containing protein [Hephaestia sp. MAHUQ-44]